MSKPNILIIMVDQLNGTLFPDGPAGWLHAPNLKALAAKSTRFANSYTASPLCAPARAAFMSGQLPSRNGVYDNAAEFTSSIPTYAHHLRRAGYQTCLSGKMHFVGPDQMHGFEERLTTDIYPADFGWTPDYRKPGERIDWWYHNMGSVTGAGVAEITNQMEYDDEVAYHATRKIYDLARGADARPWCLTVSFTHPHDPYVARRKYWDLYADCDHLMPQIGPIPYADQDPHSQRIIDANDRDKFTITDDDIRRSRRAYFANISYLDDKIGDILRVLEDTRQEATILFVSDHGDMLGERGLWFKMCFFEGSARVPLMIASPDMTPSLQTVPVSTIDVTPTLCDLAGVDMSEVMPWTSGESLVHLGQGGTRTTPVAMEYAAEASQAPLVALRSGPWKYTRCTLDPEQLFNLDTDPHELSNLATDPAHEHTLADLREQADARWDLARFDADVRQSQACRWVVYEALRNGDYYPWDYQPLQKASERYMRNHMDLNVLEENQRFPRGE
ncbi:MULTISPECIES: choline-sulfatase [unclassified Yoonia]|uniref:choline-sulfatase n=1 Tax=unclassified Yoonia TaxID=2629118 RepID=UPI002AFDE70E|nr:MULTISPECIES: choline-sulfatase [unclassified Yoonia]